MIGGRRRYKPIDHRIRVACILLAGGLAGSESGQRRAYQDIPNNCLFLHFCAVVKRGAHRHLFTLPLGN